MPDITMCGGDECPLRIHCYRYRAKPSYLQSFFIKAPIKDDGICEYYWKDQYRPDEDFGEVSDASKVKKNKVKS